MHGFRVLRDSGGVGLLTVGGGRWHCAGEPRLSPPPPRRRPKQPQEPQPEAPPEEDVLYKTIVAFGKTLRVPIPKRTPGEAPEPDASLSPRLGSSRRRRPEARPVTPSGRLEARTPFSRGTSPCGGSTVASAALAGIASAGKDGAAPAGAVAGGHAAHLRKGGRSGTHILQASPRARRRTCTSARTRTRAHSAPPNEGAHFEIGSCQSFRSSEPTPCAAVLNV